MHIELQRALEQRGRVWGADNERQLKAMRATVSYLHRYPRRYRMLMTALGAFGRVSFGDGSYQRRVVPDGFFDS